MFASKLLFANDDVLTQWIMTEVLRGAGFSVTSVCRASEVADVLDDMRDFDILIADLDLSGAEDGIDIGTYWQRALPGRPVIYTGTSQAGLLRPLRSRERFLPAPFSASTLLRAVDGALEDMSLFDTAAAMDRQLHYIH